MPFPSAGDIPDSGIKPMSSELQADALHLTHHGSPLNNKFSLHSLNQFPLEADVTASSLSSLLKRSLQSNEEVSWGRDLAKVRTCLSHTNDFSTSSKRASELPTGAEQKCLFLDRLQTRDTGVSGRKRGVEPGAGLVFSQAPR